MTRPRSKAKKMTVAGGSTKDLARVESWHSTKTPETPGKANLLFCHFEGQSSGCVATCRHRPTNLNDPNVKGHGPLPPMFYPRGFVKSLSVTWSQGAKSTMAQASTRMPLMTPRTISFSSSQQVAMRCAFGSHNTLRDLQEIATLSSNQRKSTRGSPRRVFTPTQGK